MTRTSLRSLTALALAAGMSVLALTGCQPGAIRAQSSAGAGAGGAGTVTVAISQPVQVSGHAGVSVTCATGRVYTAQAESAQIDGYQISFTVRATGYTGPGSYATLVTLRLGSSDGTVTAATGIPGVSASLNDTGGSFDLSATADNGRTLAATVSWTCS